MQNNRLCKTLQLIHDTSTYMTTDMKHANNTINFYSRPTQYIVVLVNCNQKYLNTTTKLYTFLAGLVNGIHFHGRTRL